MHSALRDPARVQVLAPNLCMGRVGDYQIHAWRPCMYLERGAGPRIVPARFPGRQHRSLMPVSCWISNYGWMNRVVNHVPDERGGRRHMDAHDEGDFGRVFEAIRDDSQNASYTERGIDPLYTAGPHAHIVIVGQAPGRIAQDTHIPWNDRSGDRLRTWLGLGRETFYDPECVAIIPMDFYFPGAGKGGDLPPRRGFAEKWHPVLLGMMPEARLIVLVGSYAVRRYLRLPASVKLTDVVRDYRAVLETGGPGEPRRFPLVHPSPRNQLWLKRNPWFEVDVLPDLRREVRAALEA